MYNTNKPMILLLHNMHNRESHFLSVYWCGFIDKKILTKATKIGTPQMSAIEKRAVHPNASKFAENKHSSENYYGQ